MIITPAAPPPPSSPPSSSSPSPSPLLLVNYNPNLTLAKLYRVFSIDRGFSSGNIFDRDRFKASSYINITD